MKRSLTVSVAVLLMGIGILGCVSSTAFAAVEPTPEPTYRDLRPDYVKTWQIFNDSDTNGILAPGDTNVESFNNWWTPVSGHTAAHAKNRSGDGELSNAPMNFSTFTLDESDPNKDNPDYNYWLPRSDNSLSFYMTYSQFDNNDWEMTDYGDTQDQININKQRNMYRNGWSLGWVSNDIAESADKGSQVKMDILVHNGEHTLSVDGLGTSRSNPQVAVGGDMNSIARDFVGDGDTTGNYHPAQYDEALQDYTWLVNQLRLEANGYTEADLNALVDSMELTEQNPYGDLVDAIYSDKTPAQLLADGVVDHEGLAYLYQDVFFERSTQTAESNDGGMISGLSGWSEATQEGGNWGDQQVIRIDIAEETLLQGEEDGKISEIVFYDFGDSDPGSDSSDQVDPRAITFLVDLTRSVEEGQIYLEDPETGERTYFPENRLYIATTNIPEPAMITLVSLGGVLVTMRRRRKQRS